MKKLKIIGLAVCLLAVTLHGQKKIPDLQDPAFESISTAYRVEYHYNKTTYTIYMPDLNSPITFKLKFPFPLIWRWIGLKRKLREPGLFLEKKY